MKINHFKKILDYFFPKNKVEKDILKKLLKSKSLYLQKDKNIIFFSYKNGVVKKSIWELKFRKKIQVGNFLGEIIYENLPEILDNLKIQENFHNPILINIPISFSKRISRGFNQNDIIIKRFYNLGGKNFIKWDRNNLKKIKNTKSQAKTKNKTERFENIKDSFALKNPKKIKKRNILLFDDVLTTGATLNEAKKVLKNSGAKKIIYMVIAH